MVGPISAEMIGKRTSGRAFRPDEPTKPVYQESDPIVMLLDSCGILYLWLNLSNLVRVVHSVFVYKQA